MKSATQRQTHILLAGGLLILVGCQLAQWWSKSEAIWGVAQVPLWLLLAPLPFLARPLATAAARGVARLDFFRLEPRWLRWLVYACLSLLAGFLSLKFAGLRGSKDFWFFEVFFRGHSGEERFAYFFPDPQWYSGQVLFPSSPFSSALHALCYNTLGQRYGWELSECMKYLNCAAGAVYVFVLCVACEWIAAPRYRIWAWLLLMALGQTMYIAGYVEFTTTGFALLLLYLLLGVRAAQGRCPLFWPAGVLAVAVFFHGSYYCMAPSLAMLCLLRYHQTRGPAFDPRAGLRAAAPFAAFVLLVASVYAVLYTVGGMKGLGNISGAVGGPFVPLRKPDVSSDDLQAVAELRAFHYTMFSLAHVFAVVNTALFLSVLTPLIPPLIWVGRKKLVRDKGFVFLCTAALFALAYAFLWNPDYGPRPDIDLYCVSSLAASVLGAYMAFGPPRLAAGQRLGPALLVFSAVHLHAVFAYWYIIFPEGLPTGLPYSG